MFQGAFLNDADPLTISCAALRDGKRCQGIALIRASPFTQAGLATWVVSYLCLFSKKTSMCEYQ